MKIVVIGGTGLIGSKVVEKLTAHGHEVIAASPSSGVNAVTGKGLAEVLAGAQVVVDVTNSPSFEDDAVLEFFQKSTRNLLAAEAEAGVGHHVALSVVGTQELAESGYFRGKIAQENLIRSAGRPYSIVQATQFFEFIPTLVHFAMPGDEVRFPSALIQPIASDDVATAVARTAAGEPLNGTLEIAGPTQYQLDELIRKATGRHVVTDPDATYAGARLQERTLVPGDGALIFETVFTVSNAGA